MERRAAALLEQLMSEIHGWSGIVPVSGWRSQEEEQAIWDGSMREYGAGFTQKYVARPGCSEHLTGLAIDLGLRQEQVDFIRPDFPDSGICRTFRKRAAAFGFIQRYPADKEPITGIACEPWHFRYVGVPHAEIMIRLGLTLEEYHDFLKQHPYDVRPLVYERENLVFELSYLSAEKTEDLETESFSGMVSGDNSDGFIVTEWKDRGI
jgi:D-alanyl-D-alanine dipeptidase/carboxypeptidase